jgi:hypothetical protein
MGLGTKLTVIIVMIHIGLSLAGYNLGNVDLPTAFETVANGDIKGLPDVAFNLGTAPIAFFTSTGTPTEIKLLVGTPLVVMYVMAVGSFIARRDF